MARGHVALRSRNALLPYSQLMVAAVALAPEPKRGLILGHGGGSLAKWLALVWPELELDVVEFDPAVVRMAEQYFEYRPPANHHVFVKDARVFLRDTHATYDVIWVDAFARHLIPFHLTTVEFFSELRGSAESQRRRGTQSRIVGRRRRSSAGERRRADTQNRISYYRGIWREGTMEGSSNDSREFDLFWRRSNR